MGDTSLDEFFARKDRNKKNKKKLRNKDDANSDSTTDALTKDKKAKEAFCHEGDEEWEAVEAVVEVDINDLKIQSMKVSDQTAFKEVGDDSGRVNDGTVNAWKTAEKVEPEPVAVVVAPVPAIVAPEPVSSTPTAYVPPWKKANRPASNSTLDPVRMNVTGSRRGPRAPPQTNSHEEFPSLGR